MDNQKLIDMTVVQMCQNIKQMLVFGSDKDKDVIQGAVRDLLVVVGYEKPSQIYQDMAERCANVAERVAGIDVKLTVERAEDMIEVNNLYQR